MQKTKINGNDLEYSIHGDITGEWIVLIHGSVFADMFLPMITQASLSKYSILHYHRRGYGGSTINNTSQTSMNDLAAECLQLMDFLSIDSAHIVSHSYAGLIALQAAVNNPKKINSLTLMEPPLAPFVPSGQDFGNKLMTSFGLYQEGKKFETLDYFLRVVFEGTQDYRKIIDSNLGNKAFDDALLILDTLYKVEFPALQSWKFDLNNVKTISKPVLSVEGGDSPSFFKDVHSLLHTWFPHLETLVVPNTSHILHMQEPELVANGLNYFFTKHHLENKRGP
jgi:pimeloyl-ACP methyl ester carboxylesterase